MKATRGSRQSKMTRSFYIGAIAIGSIVVIMLQVRWMGRQKPTFRQGSYHQYTKIIDLETVKIFCDYCEGAGLVRDPASAESMTVCPVCDGIGVHHVRFVKDSDVVCPDCRGLGRVPGDVFGEAAVCVRCDGRGLLGQVWDKLRIPVQQVSCDHCDGRGVLRNAENPIQLDMCPICFGRGSRIVRRLDTHDELCTGCGGMGRLEDSELGVFRTCRLCDGRGISALPADHDFEATRSTATQ